MTGRARLNLALAALLGLLVAAHAAIPSDPTRRNLHFFPDMVFALPLEAQGARPLLPDGEAFDPRPAAGSLARGYAPLLEEAPAEEAATALPAGTAGTADGAVPGAGAGLTSPLADDDPEAAERGRVVFENFCSTCHGPGGLGDGPVTGRGVPPPPSLLADHARGLSDGEIFFIVTKGQGNMASYASQVERIDRWNVVRYLRTLQGAP